MDFRVLQALRERLEQDDGIAAFMASTYPGATLSFFIGLKPDFDPARKIGTGVPLDRFPYIALSPITHATPNVTSRTLSEGISLNFGLYDDREENGVYLGIPAMCGFAEAILRALAEQPLCKEPNAVWNLAAEVDFDAGAWNPYYEGQIPLTIEVRK